MSALMDVGERGDVMMTRVDVMSELETQGVHECVLMKLTDWMIRAEFEPDTDAGREAHDVLVRVQAYIDRHADTMTFHDPLEHVRVILHRERIHRLIQRASIITSDGVHVTSPHAVVVTAPLSDATDLPAFPVICKRLPACGTPASHEMMILTKA